MTLMELVIAIGIMGIAFVAIIGTWQSNLYFSDRQRKVTDGQAVLVSAADRLNSQNRLPVDCIVTSATDRTTSNTDTPGGIREQYQTTLSAVLLTPYDNWTVTIPPGGVLFWDGTDYTNQCWVDKGYDLQLVQLVAKSADGKTDETMWVVKGDD